MWLTISMTMAACSLALWGWWLGRPFVRERPATAAEHAGRQLLWLRLLWPWVEAVAPVLGPFLSWRTRRRLEHLLASAGVHEQWTPSHFCAFQAVLGGLVGGAVAFWLSGMFSSFVTAMVAMAAAALAVVWPLQRLREKVKHRKRSISRAFPFLLDMVTLCVEAGLNLHGALQQAAQHGPEGPLRDELQHMLADVRAGATRTDALSRWAERCDLPAMHYFVSAVAQADQFGMSLGPILRAQADQRRNERFLRAERLAQEAPVKLMFPLVFCIFPCSFAIIAFPIAAQFMMSFQ